MYEEAREREKQPVCSTKTLLISIGKAETFALDLPNS
jgi:hypothetical protein